MKYKHVVILGSLLFFVASSVYGYLTGSTFFTPSSVYGYLNRLDLFHSEGSPFTMYDLIVLSLILVSVYGVAIFALQKLNVQSFQLVDWLLPTLFGLIPMAFSWTGNDWKGFRIYVAPISLFALTAFSIYSIFFLKKQDVCLSVNKAGFVKLMALVFGIGIAIYVIKDRFNLVGNYNSAMQFLLCMLCVVMPSFYALVAVQLKLLSLCRPRFSGQ